MFFQAAIDRKRPNVIELQIVVPSKTSLVIRMDFEKTLLRYTEYPPDANRGFDVP